MDTDIGSIFTMLLVGYAVGATFVAILTRGRPRETIVVVPETGASSESGIGCGLLAVAVLGFIALALLLTR